MWTRLFALLALTLLPSTSALADPSQDITIPPRVRPSPLDELTADGRPTPDAIAVLSSHTRGRVTRISVGNVKFEARHVRLDSLGVTFVAEPGTDERRPGTSAPRYDSTDPRSGLSPIPWAAIDGLETRRSSVLLGIVAGTVVMSYVALAVADRAGSDPGPGIIIVFAFPPAGAVLGGLVGAGIRRWHHEWPPRVERPRTTRSK